MERKFIVFIFAIALFGLCYGPTSEYTTAIEVGPTIKAIDPVTNNELQTSEIKKLIDDLSEQIRILDENNRTSFELLSNNLSNTRKKTNQEIENILTKYSNLLDQFDKLSNNQIKLQDQSLKDIKLLNEKTDSLKIEHEKLSNDFNYIIENTNKELILVKKDLLSRFLINFTAFFFLLVVTVCTAIFFQKKFKKINILEDTIRLDAKISEILENQLILKKNEVVNKNEQGVGEGVNHSLAISVGSEIYRMRKRIEHMDPDTKGINALKSALTRLEDEFNQQGYSLIDLTGMPYTVELTVKVVNYVQQKDIEPGKSIISRMITPQIYYNGIVVSHGEAEVTTSAKDAQQL